MLYTDFAEQDEKHPHSIISLLRTISPMSSLPTTPCRCERPNQPPSASMSTTPSLPMAGVNDPSELTKFAPVDIVALLKRATLIRLVSRAKTSRKVRHFPGAEVMRTYRGSSCRLDVDVWKAEPRSGKMGPVCASLNVNVVTGAPDVIARCATVVPLGEINDTASRDVFARKMQHESIRLM